MLIIGGSGFIGTHLALKLRDSYKVYATYRKHRIAIPGATLLPFNVDNRNWVKHVVYAARPDVIIFAAGSNDAEWAEANARFAEHIHTGGAAMVSNVADILQPKFIYLSNCYTFDGMRGNYHETDTVLPFTALGKAKLGGENFIRGKSLNYVILRSSPVFGRGNGLSLSFIDSLRMKLDRHERIEISDRELHSFTPVDGLIDLITRVMESGIKNKILHYGGLTKVTHLEFARQFAKKFGYDPSLIVPRQEQQKKGRKSNIDQTYDFSLNSTQVTEILKVKPLLLEEGLDLVEKKLVSGF